MDRTQMMNMSNEEFAIFLSNYEGYIDEDKEIYVQDPEFYFLLQFTDARVNENFDLMTNNFDLWNELHMRTREYAQSLPRGSLRRSIYYSSANEIDHFVQTPARVRPVVARVTTPRLPRREYTNEEIIGIAGANNRARRRLSFSEEPRINRPRRDERMDE